MSTSAKTKQLQADNIASHKAQVLAIFKINEDCTFTSNDIDRITNRKGSERRISELLAEGLIIRSGEIRLNKKVVNFYQFTQPHLVEMAKQHEYNKAFQRWYKQADKFRSKIKIELL
jgi:hypothetical protein